ncbi:MAG: pitrilysin family protein [Patescibacteria group bacterium]|nr:pitrilysin family protein [Patescibacteria group bacterium]
MNKSFIKKILKNGLRVILIPQPSSLATTVMVLVRAGSKYETKKINGISHFLEHMCFKGTKKRANQMIISSELDGLGASYNAFTDREFTGYYAKVKNESFDEILDVISDMYLNPVFNVADIEKERGVIIEEINMYEDMPNAKVGDVFMRLMYGDQPAGWSIAGEKEVIKKLKQEDFINYRSKHYLAQSSVLIIAGGFDKKEISQKIEKQFLALDQGEKGSKIKTIESQQRSAQSIFAKETDQSHMIMGFRAFNFFDDRRYALEVLVDILGGGMSSRLFQKIRSELGAAYYVGASADLFSDHGFIVMSAGIKHEEIKKVIKAGLEEFKKLKGIEVQKEELERAKNHLIGGLFLSLETSDSLASFYGGKEIMGLPLVTPRDIARKIKAVNAEEIKALAQSLFVKKNLNLAIVGPYKNKSFSDILKI